MRFRSIPRKRTSVLKAPTTRRATGRKTKTETDDSRRFETVRRVLPTTLEQQDTSGGLYALLVPLVSDRHRLRGAPSSCTRTRVGNSVPVIFFDRRARVEAWTFHYGNNERRQSTSIHMDDTRDIYFPLHVLVSRAAG